MKAKGKLKIKEIAELAGVSPTAVSFALNNKKGISAETEKRIMEIVEAYDYVPDKNSLRLNHKKSYNVCLMMKSKASPFDDLFYFGVSKGIMQRGMHYNYNIVMSQVEDDQTKVPDIIRQNDADGVIIFQNANEELIRELDEYSTPYVFVDLHSSNAKRLKIKPDYEVSAFTATEYLIKHGHKKIGILAPDFIPEYQNKTMKGFYRALEKYDITVNPKWIGDSCNSEHDAYKFMEKILTYDVKPTAIFGVGDIYAIGAMRCASANGYKVPDDFSFIGLDDLILSKYLSVPLTTISYNKIEIGNLAMDMIMKRINGEAVESIVVKSDIIVERSSVKKIG